MARRRVRTWVASISMWMVRIVFAVILAFPFYWMLITTFKRTTDLYNLKNNPFVFNESPTLEHLRLLFHETLFVRWALNTAFAGAIVVTITLLLALPAAYALARLTGGWGAQLGIGVFLTYLIPPTLLFIPLSRIVARLDLQDSLWSIIVVYPSFTIPFSTWLLMGFFKSIPRDLEDAALVDGLTRWGAFIKLVWRTHDGDSIWAKSQSSASVAFAAAGSSGSVRPSRSKRQVLRPIAGRPLRSARAISDSVPRPPPRATTPSAVRASTALRA